MTRTGPTPEEMQWALAEASKEAVGVAPGWFRAWPTADERWSAVNVRSATQVIVNHSREDERHPEQLDGPRPVRLATRSNCASARTRQRRTPAWWRMPS